LHQFGAEHKRDLHVECHTRWRNNLDIIDKLLTDDSNAGNWNKLAEQYNACEDVRNAYNLLLTLHQRAALHLQYDRLDDSIKTSVEQLLNHTDDDTKLKSLVLYMVNNNDADADAYQVRNGLVYQLYINEWDFRPSMTKYLQDNQNNLPEVPFLIE
jgi:hypothetical protein